MQSCETGYICSFRPLCIFPSNLSKATSTSSSFNGGVYIPFTPLPGRLDVAEELGESSMSFEEEGPLKLTNNMSPCLKKARTTYKLALDPKQLRA